MGLPLERDEGEYAYIAQQLLQGVLPYTESHSMKFPGIFFAYAGVLIVFGQSPIAIHFSLLFTNIATAFLLYLLGSKLLNQSAGIVAGISFSALTLSPSLQGTWANSEHFVLLPAIGGVLLLWVSQEKPTRFILSGFLLGFALLIKQHAVFFFLFGLVFLSITAFAQSYKLKKLILSIGFFLIGGVVPIITSATLYWLYGNFSDFWFSTFQYASEYASMVSLSQGFEDFKYSCTHILESNFSILLLSLIGIVAMAPIKRARREYLFIFGFFLFSFLAITPGLYFRPHYFLLWMPAFSLFAGAGFTVLMNRFLSSRFKPLISLGILTLVLGLPVWIQKDFFFTLPVFKATKLVYGSNPFVESLEVAKYIREHSQKDDRVAVLGSEPQIYFYAQRRSATRHIYMYPLMEKHIFAHEMQLELIREIESSQPKFIVLVNVPWSWKFKRDSSPLLRAWAPIYLNKEYKVSGMIDVFSHKEPLYKWGEKASKYTPVSSKNIIIYERRT